MKNFLFIISISLLLILKISSLDTIVIESYEPTTYSEYNEFDKNFTDKKTKYTSFKCASELKAGFCYYEHLSSYKNLILYFGSCDSSHECAKSDDTSVSYSNCKVKSNKFSHYKKEKEACTVNEECQTKYCNQGKCEISNTCTATENHCDINTYSHQKENSDCECLSYRQEDEECNDSDLFCDIGLVCNITEFDDNQNYKKGRCIKEMSQIAGSFVTDRKACKSYMATKLVTNNDKKVRICIDPIFDKNNSCTIDSTISTKYPCLFYFNYTDPVDGVKNKVYYKYSDCVKVEDKDLCPPVLGDGSDLWNDYVNAYTNNIVGMSQDNKKYNRYVDNYGENDHIKKYLKWRFDYLFKENINKECIEKYIQDIKHVNNGFWTHLSFGLLIAIFLLILI